jgi:hypothetical protein
MAFFPLLGSPGKGPPVNFAPSMVVTGFGANVQAERKLLWVNQKSEKSRLFPVKPQ